MNISHLHEDYGFTFHSLPIQRAFTSLKSTIQCRIKVILLCLQNDCETIRRVVRQTDRGQGPEEDGRVWDFRSFCGAVVGWQQTVYKRREFSFLFLLFALSKLVIVLFSSACLPVKTIFRLIPPLIDNNNQPCQVLRTLRLSYLLVVRLRRTAPRYT